MLVEEKLYRKLTDDEKEKLKMRIGQVVSEDLLTLADWLNIYDIMARAANREKIRLREEMLVQSFSAPVEGGIQ